jgi:hypothetical protein
VQSLAVTFTIIGVPRYEIGLCVRDNRCVIRREKQGFDQVWTTAFKIGDLLAADKYTKFWITWLNGKIAIGKVAPVYIIDPSICPLSLVGHL